MREAPNTPANFDFDFDGDPSKLDQLATPTPTPAPATPAPATRPAATVTAGTRRHGDQQYTGVVRHGRRVITDCGHIHTNRDMTYPSSGLSARDCADRIIRGARRPATADSYADSIRTAWTRLSPITFTASTIAAAKTGAQTAADAYLAAVALVRAYL
jgi:hypothetical protein